MGKRSLDARPSAGISNGVLAAIANSPARQVPLAELPRFRFAASASALGGQAATFPLARGGEIAALGNNLLVKLNGQYYYATNQSNSSGFIRSGRDAHRFGCDPSRWTILPSLISN